MYNPQKRAGFRVGETEVASIVRDPVHEYISLYADELSVIESRDFQRLRQVKQNAMAFLTYPSCIGSRFEHSLGTKHLAERMFLSAMQKSNPSVVDAFLAASAEELEFDDGAPEVVLRRLSRLIRISALTHDLGHHPFSHTLEELMESAVDHVLSADDLPGWTDFRTSLNGKLHEYIGILLLERSEEVRTAIGEDLPHITALLRTPPGGTSVLSTLHEMISFDVDADRCDYLVRDGKTSGADFGNIDVDRLVESMRLQRVEFGEQGEKTRFLIRPTIKALSAIEAMLVERYKAYRWLYYHPKVVAANAILREACFRLYQASVDGSSPIGDIGLDLRYGDPIAPRADGMTSHAFDDIYIWSFFAALTKNALRPSLRSHSGSGQKPTSRS